MLYKNNFFSSAIIKFSWRKEKYTTALFLFVFNIMYIRYDDTYKYVDCTYVESSCRCFSVVVIFSWKFLSHTSNLIMFSSHFSSLPGGLLVPVYLISFYCVLNDKLLQQNQPRTYEISCEFIVSFVTSRSWLSVPLLLLFSLRCFA